MKRIGFILLCSVLFLCSCQEELKDVPGQDISESKARLWTIKALDGTPQTKAVGVKDKLWAKGDTIRIKFLTGGSYSADLENVVKQYAATWLQYANSLHFEYVAENEDADVKIGFDMDDRYLTWSTIGKDCQGIAQNQPSINYSGLGDLADDADICGDVLRGFGHILGLVFENQSPDSPIVFSANGKKQLAAYYGLSEQDVAQLTYIYNTSETNYSQYDPSSIMVLEINRKWLSSGSGTNSNTELSAQDIIWAENNYESDKPAVNVDSLAIVNMNALNAHIAAQAGRYQLYIGINYDGGEKLPFIAYTWGGSSYWVGYVSNGVVHRSPGSIFSTRICFILQNELYIITKHPSFAAEFVTYSLPGLEQTFSYSGFSGVNQHLSLPYLYNGKKYITGGNVIENKTMSFQAYNLDDKQKETYNIEFPLEEEHRISCDMMFVKNGFVYCAVSDTEKKQTNIYKFKLETWDQLSLIGTLNGLTNDYRVTTSVNGSFYVACAQGKILIVDQNDNVEWKDFPSAYVMMGYGNKLYWAGDGYFTSACYQEYIIQ